MHRDREPAATSDFVPAGTLLQTSAGETLAPRAAEAAEDELARERLPRQIGARERERRRLGACFAAARAIERERRRGQCRGRQEMLADHCVSLRILLWRRAALDGNRPARPTDAQPSASIGVRGGEWQSGARTPAAVERRLDEPSHRPATVAFQRDQLGHAPPVVAGGGRVRVDHRPAAGDRGDEHRSALGRARLRHWREPLLEGPEGRPDPPARLRPVPPRRRLPALSRFARRAARRSPRPRGAAEDAGRCSCSRAKAFSRAAITPTTSPA